MTEVEAGRPVKYDRDVLVTVLIYHGRTSIKGCHCGWAKPGASHPEHVADVYEESVRVLGGSTAPPTASGRTPGPGGG